MSPLAATAQQADTSSTRQAVALPDSSKLRPFGGVVLSSDSLLRWQQWSGFGEWASRQPGMVARGLGGYGRNTAISTTTPLVNSDRIRWNGVILNNPLTGQYNSAEIPLDQSARLTHFNQGSSEFAIDPLVFSVMKPLTVIRYEQSSYEYRNLDGQLAMPVNESIMVQASYQGQKDDGKYARSNFEGRRATGNVQYRYNDRWTADVFWLYQGAEMQESMGYVFDDPSSFTFDRFRAQAISGNTASMRRLLLTGVSLSRAGNVSNQNITLYRKLHLHEWRSVDTTTIRAQEWGLATWYDFSLGNRMHLKTYLDAAVVSNDFGDAITLDNTPNAVFNIGYRAQFDLSPRVELGSQGELSSMITRDVNFLDLYARFGMLKSTLLTVGRTIRNDDPRSEGSGLTSRGYSPILYATELDGSRWYARVDNLTGIWKYNLGLHYTKSVKFPVITGGVIFDAGVNDYFVASGELERNNDRTEFSIGYYASDLIRQNIEQRIQVGGYLKGYAFNRAAYLKGGAVFYASINESLSKSYLPEYGLWIQGREFGAIPDHHRLDLEFAARVRSMILTGRLENTLDGWTQKGYFQTLPYPMPGRRFRIGLKVHFRD